MSSPVKSNKRRGAVIFDRDGVLNVDVGYAHRPDQIIWIPGAIEAVKFVNDSGFHVFVATNQSGVARGYYTEHDVQNLHSWMNSELSKAGAHIDAFAYSPFHPAGTIAEYSRISDCRKPGPGMINFLLTQWNIDPNNAVLVGDQPTDGDAASNAGIAFIKFDGKDLVGCTIAAIKMIAPCSDP